MSHLKISTVDHDCTYKAVSDLQVHDLEDGIQYYSALKHGCEYIITEDTNDFYFSSLKVVRCEYFLKEELKLS